MMLCRADESIPEGGPGERIQQWCVCWTRSEQSTVAHWRCGWTLMLKCQRVHSHGVLFVFFYTKWLVAWPTTWQHYDFSWAVCTASHIINARIICKCGIFMKVLFFAFGFEWTTRISPSGSICGYLRESESNRLNQPQVKQMRVDFDFRAKLTRNNRNY